MEYSATIMESDLYVEIKKQPVYDLVILFIEFSK